jgi:trk system potassium uptake protein
MYKDNPKFNIKEKFFRWLFIASDQYRLVTSMLSGLCRFFFIISLFIFIICFLFFIGFAYPLRTEEALMSAIRVSFFIIFISKYLPEVLFYKRDRGISLVFRTLNFLFTFLVFISNFNIVNHERSFWLLFYGNTMTIVAAFLIGISELSGLLKLLSATKIPPSLVFSLSFIVIIFIGSALLLLPNAHNGQLSYLDSLFTAVSSVCVTGLVVVNTATSFTTMGKIVILSLIQIGGLGIMTFTGFFSYIFTTSSSSFRDRLLLKEIFSSESLNNLFKLLTKIILLTFMTEIIGALVIYSSLDWRIENKLMFSIFHSVSAFCNAGFSTLSEGLFSPGIRYNNSVHISIAVLVILGGIGFPVLLNGYSYIKHLVIILIRKAERNRIPVKPEMKNYSTRIVLFMTVLLIISGTGLYYLFESDVSLKGMDNTQKIINSFFGSVSARTAGFNIVDISLWSYPTMFLMMLLMWIGASPGSTGGGIKTTTVALLFKSVWNNLRGRDHLVAGNREIGSNTITRILSILFLSIILITAGFFGLLLSEPNENPMHLLFECFSAFGTVGLSVANTGTFSHTGKIIVILLMFIGRVGPLTLFTGIMISYRKRYFRYPELEIVIN